MSNGDDETDETPEGSDGDGEPSQELSVDTLGNRLDEAEAAIETAETESDLDDVESDLDDIESDLEAAELPEPEDDDDEDLTEELHSRLEALYSTLEEARGPYAEDVEAIVEEVAGTVRETRWTEDGKPDVLAAVETFLAAAGAELDAEFTPDGAELDDHAAALEDTDRSIAEAGLDADDDAETIEALLSAAEELQTAIENAEQWDDLSVREQLRAQGFYDRMTAENRKDFPPELTAVRVAEAENDPERILLALEKLESDFMQENCIDALRRLGSQEAFEVMHQRAEKRDRPSIEVLGKIGDERAVETLLEYVDSDNPPLQKVTLRALGEIGSGEATQTVANALEDDEYVVRSQAARALGLIGDTRGIEPLSSVLDDDEEANSVRASAAWALVQIGTERALDAAAEYTDDRAYTVQLEAEKARDAAA